MCHAYLFRAMEKAANARPVWNGGDKYHVTMSAGGHKIIVNLDERTCACRKWQLTGIPCFHACACIFFKKQSSLDYMHECHRRENCLKVYSHILDPINGEAYWDETEAEPPLPPLRRKAPGRPKKNKDKTKDVMVESKKSDPTRLKRKGTSVQCSYCSEWGHNTRSCKTRVCHFCCILPFCLRMKIYISLFYRKLTCQHKRKKKDMWTIM